MLQADTQLNQKPDNINVEEIGMSWRELKEAILDAHKPIQDKFFKGIGNRLQFEDSCIAENIMLQFTEIMQHYLYMIVSLCIMDIALMEN